MHRHFHIEPRVLIVVTLCITLVALAWMLLNAEPPTVAVMKESELPVAENVRQFKEPGPHYMRRENAG